MRHRDAEYVPAERDERKDASLDAKLGESADRFQLLIDSVVDYGIFFLNPKGCVESWNTGAARLTGYTAQEILGKHFSIFYPSAEAAAGKGERELDGALTEGRFEDEGWRLRKDGSQFWANVVVSAIRNRNGDLVGFANVTRDMTQRLIAEEDLRRSEERLRLLIASVKDYAIFVLDPTGHVATWNPGAERLKGYAASEIIGQHFSRFYPEADILAGKCERELEGAVRLGRFEDEGWRIRKDGTRFWANVVITPIQHGGSLLGFAKVTRDLSERKHLEEERIALARAEEGRRIAEENQARARTLAENLRAARDKAEQATRIKDEFLATVSHELRTPLNAMLGWGRLLHEGSLTPEKSARAIDAIVRNATAQSHIIDDLLDVSRIIAGELRLDMDFIDIAQSITAALEVVRPAAEAKEVSLSHSLDPEVGAIRADAGRIQQVLWNLLTNAVKFTPRGGSVKVVLRREASSVQVEIIDTGKGIAADFLPRIFQRFTQAESSNARTAGGLGLGLAIVKHLVELHGGTVGAYSEGEGLGSSFIVRIPIAPIQPARSVAQPFEHSDATTFPRELQGLRVLLIDDEPDARELVQLVLEKGGAIVTIATSSAHALALIRGQKPDVIVSDIGMPEEDGYVFIQRLRALPPDEGGRIPAVALTAYARAEDRKKALLAGFQNHAAKPIEPQELVIVIANLVGRFV